MKSDEPFKYLKPVTRQLLCALDFLAKNCVIHRDVKPENILHRAEQIFYLSDFGLSTMQNDKASLVGTWAYPAPEILCLVLPTPKADVFSLGLVMLKILELLPECRMKSPFDCPDYHHTVRATVSKNKPEISPMLLDDPDKRFTAEKCVTSFFGSDQRSSIVFQRLQSRKSLPPQPQIP